MNFFLQSKNVVLVLDFGSPHTTLLTQRLREFRIAALCFPACPVQTPMWRIKALNPKVIILSGGLHSVLRRGAPTVEAEFFPYVTGNGIPVLGLSYGFHLIVELFGGKVEEKPGWWREVSGREKISVVEGSRLYGGATEGQTVWMNHVDEVVHLPPGFKVVATTAAQGKIAAIENVEANIYAQRYYPVFMKTEKGHENLRYFLFDVCGVTADWDLQNVLKEELEEVNRIVGPDDHVSCLLSGDVESTVAAALVHEAIGTRLHCLFVDNGLLRNGDRARAMAVFETDLHLPVDFKDANEQFLGKLKGVVNPIKKREVIEAEYKAVFNEFLDNLERDPEKNLAFSVRKILHPHVIKSYAPLLGRHYWPKQIAGENFVAGDLLGADLKLKLVEPLIWLFPNEVREMGKLLGVPAAFVSQHPLHWTGLATQIIGDVTNGQSLKIVRLVDECFVNCIKEVPGLYDKIWKAFAVSLRPGGNDKVGELEVVALRAVTSDSNGINADWCYFTGPFLAYVSSKICKIPGVGRVVYDITSGPPLSVHWE